MLNTEIDVLFPPRIIPQLKDLRDDAWRDLVTETMEQLPAAPHRLAFVVLMIRLGGCQSCHADTYRAMRGCMSCSINTIKRYRGTDQELMDQYTLALRDVERHLALQSKDSTD